jgi:hypothetical protein
MAICGIYCTELGRPCHNLATGLYRITDGYDRTYEWEACEECAEFWFKHRPKCTRIKNLKAKRKKNASAPECHGRN